MGTEYRGFTIIKTYQHGQTYWRIDGYKKLYSRQKDAKYVIDTVLDALEA